MSTTVGIDEARSQLKELISQLGPDDEVVITENNRPIARLVGARQAQPRYGGCNGMLTIVQDDDEHLADFTEYMP